MLHVDCSVRVLFKPNSLLSVGLELHSLSLATPVSGWGLKCNKVKRVVGILIFKIFFLNCTFATAAAVRLSVWCSTIWPSTGYLPSPLPLAWSQRAQLHHSLVGVPSHESRIIIVDFPCQLSLPFLFV